VNALNIAFHFDADLIRDEYKIRYDFPVLKAIFQSLLESNFHNLHLKIFVGDLLTYGHPLTKDKKSLNYLIDGLLGLHFSIWRDIDQRFVNSLFTKSIFVVAIEGLSGQSRDHLLKRLKEEKSYLGSLQIYGANVIHWDLYQQSLIPRYRYINRDLRIFYSKDDDIDGGDDDKDDGLEHYWRRTLNFDSVTWENLGYRYSVFDVYDSFEQAKRLAELGDILSDRLLQLADDLLMRTGDLNPKLQNTLLSAFRTFYIIQTSEDIAQVALSCRRFLKHLADTLYPPRSEKVEGREVNDAKYRNRLWAYIKARFNETQKDALLFGFEDLGKRIDKIDELANKGLHDKISTIEVDRLLIALITVTHDLLSLAPLPLSPSSEPFFRSD
jgi:hypothetical protein